MRKKILIAQLLLLGTLFEMCGNGNTKSPGTTGNAQPSDTTFFVGQHKLYISDLGFDTSFVDTTFVVKPSADSIAFYYNHVNRSKQLFVLERFSFRFKSAGVIGDKYTREHATSSTKSIVYFQLQDTSNTGKPCYDSIYYDIQLSFDSGRVIWNDELVGHVINK